MTGWVTDKSIICCPNLHKESGRLVGAFANCLIAREVESIQDGVRSRLRWRRIFNGLALHLIRQLAARLVGVGDHRVRQVADCWRLHRRYQDLVKIEKDKSKSGHFSGADTLRSKTINSDQPCLFSLLLRFFCFFF